MGGGRGNDSESLILKRNFKANTFCAFISSQRCDEIIFIVFINSAYSKFSLERCALLAMVQFPFCRSSPFAYIPLFVNEKKRIFVKLISSFKVNKDDFPPGKTFLL